MQYETIIGLEVHAQMSTQTKIFCSCSTQFGSEPNKNTCPVCLGLPGVLPVLNKEVAHFALKAALALNCEIQAKSLWARKNYFYPDLPKGYQISQYEEPIALRGYLDIILDGLKKRIGITRIHMEEDAGKLLHDYGDDKSSHVDLNRAGVPLIEIVSEPDMRSSQEAGEYMRNLRSILRYCGVCDGNMEEGSLRCDANVSIRPVGQKKFGTKVEIKNINSFKFVEKALDYEVERQKAVLAAGQEIAQETRLFNSAEGTTHSMRSKEDAHDYRYFPDPDLVPLLIDDKWISKVRAELPELPMARADRFAKEYQLPEYDANVLTAEKEQADYFEEAVNAFKKAISKPLPPKAERRVAEVGGPQNLGDANFGGDRGRAPPSDKAGFEMGSKKISNWIMTELMRELKDSGKEISQSPVSPAHLAKLVELIENGTISGKIGKTVFEEMFAGGKDPESIIKEKNLVQVSDTGAIEKIINGVIAANPKQLEQYRSGKDKLFGFFVGQVMKEMKGQGNPGVVNDLLKKKLKG